ncbi:transposase [Streptomyces sp. 6N223]|uniref:transposase n=1 Tax=Streptomyces sp. 6N223 TaxID=3457412 RepID=UPI003FD1B01B
MPAFEGRRLRRQHLPRRPPCGFRKSPCRRCMAVRLQEQDAVLERFRAEQATDEWKDRCAARAGLEGTIHQAVATAGVRRTRNVGLAKTHLAQVLTAVDICPIRLDAWWNDTLLARTRTSRLAALDLAA